MKAIILAGGFGTRLRPLTESRPKPLLPLMNKPMIMYILDSLPAEVDQAVIAAGFKIDLIRDFFAENDYPFEITVIEEKDPLGTGGGIKNCSEFIPENSEFLAFNGDVVSSIDLSDFINYFHSKGGLGAIALWPVADPSRYGRVELDENNKITQFIEKSSVDSTNSPDTKFHINAGTYIFSSEMLESIPSGKQVSIEREVFPNVLERGLFGYSYGGYWIDAGTVQDYINAHRILFDSPQVFSTDLQSEIISILKEDFPGAKIISPVFLGSDVELGSHCTIGPYVCLGENIKIGNDCKITNSVIMDGTSVGSGTVIENAVVGFNNTIGNNCKLNNFIITAEGKSLEDGAVID